MVRRLFQTLTTVLLLLCSGCVLLVLTVGCERPPDMPAGYVLPPPRTADVVTDTPEHTTQSLFEFLRRYLDAVAAHDSVQARLARDQVAWHLVAQREIMARMGDRGVQDAKKAQILNTLVENWAAMINYYADGLALDRMQPIRHGTERNVVLRVPAHGPHDDAVLDVLCTLGDDEQWRVLELEFEVPPPASSRAPLPPQPTSQPATSQPAR